jgi:hypothetical protein
MSRVITLELSDELVDRAERLAALSSRGVAQILAEAVAVALPPVGLEQLPINVRELSDGEVHQLAKLELPSELDSRLSLLLSDQQAGTLTAEGRSELTGLMQHYEAGLLRKSEALAEAARRGLQIA